MNTVEVINTMTSVVMVKLIIGSITVALAYNVSSAYAVELANTNELLKYTLKT